MPFVTDDFSLKRNVPTLALKSTDDFKVFQLVETVKDAFIRELRNFFAQTSGAARYAETINIEKYAISQVGADPFENLITLIREYPDISQKLPLISVTKASGSRKPVSVTGAFVDHVQYAPRVRSSESEPYDLSSVLDSPTSPTILFTTRPDGVIDRTSTMVLSTVFFPTPAAVTAQQIVNAINLQALYARARTVIVGSDTYVEIMAGGPIRITKATLPPINQPRKYVSGDLETPDRIEIIGGTAALLTVLGFTVGQHDDSDNPLRPPCNRYASAANFSIGIDVGATSDNERTEITDLLTYFLNVYLSDRDYTFYGQHVFEEAAAGSITERFFQITLGDWSMSGEADIPRPDGEKEDKIFANRFNIPVVVFDYVDRIIPSNLIPPVAQVRQTPFIANDQPTNITGVSILEVSYNTADGEGTLTYVAGSVKTLQWKAPGSAVAGAAVSVGGGGIFVLAGGDGSSIRVRVLSTALNKNAPSQPVNITGVLIDSVNDATLAGVGALSFTISGVDRLLQWDPPGAEGAGPAVNVSAGGVFTLVGASALSSIQVRVDAPNLPDANVPDSITISGTFSDSITLTRELPGVS